MSAKEYTNTTFYRTLKSIALKHLEKNHLDELSCEYLREKGNYEYAVRMFGKYLSSTDFDMNTHIIFSVPDHYLNEFIKNHMKEQDVNDPKTAVLIGKMVFILNELLMKNINISELWPARKVRCDCGTLCNLISAEAAYGHSAVVKQNLQHRYYYRCPICGAMVGTHIGTNIPLGNPVHKLTAEMRKKTHERMEEVIQNHQLERTDIYQYLSQKLPDLDKKKVHVGYFDVSTCIKANRLLDQLAGLNAPKIHSA